MKILLKGYYGWGNLGDDVLMVVVYNWLKGQFPLATIDIFSGFTKNNTACKPDKHTYHNYIHNLLPDKPVIVDWATKKHYDLLVQGGGGIHFDHSHGGAFYSILNKVVKFSGAKAIASGERILRKSASKMLPISFSKKIGLGIGIGNFNPDSIRFVHHASHIGDYNFIWVRDKLSEYWLDKLAFSGKVIRATDLAFNYKSWRPDMALLQTKRPKSIGVVTLTKDTLTKKDYEAQYEFIRALIDKGYDVRIYLFQEIVDKNLVASFKGVAPVKVWLPEKQYMQDYLLDLGTNELIISGRAHGIILGACMGVPGITLETSTKLKEVSKMFPETSHLVAPDVKADKLLEIVAHFFAHQSSFSEKLAQEVETNKLLVEEALTKVADYLK